MPSLGHDGLGMQVTPHLQHARLHAFSLFWVLNYSENPQNAELLILWYCMHLSSRAAHCSLSLEGALARCVYSQSCVLQHAWGLLIAVKLCRHAATAALHCNQQLAACLSAVPPCMLLARGS